MSQNENLKAFLDGELSNAETTELRDLIQNDPNLKSEIDELQKVQFVLRSQAKDIKPEGMEALLRRVTKPQKSPWWIRAGGVVSVGAAAVAVFIVLQNRSLSKADSGAEVQQVAMQEGSALDRASSERSQGLTQDPSRAMEEAMKVPESGSAPTSAPKNRGTGTKDVGVSKKASDEPTKPEEAEKEPAPKKSAYQPAPATSLAPDADKENKIDKQPRQEPNQNKKKAPSEGPRPDTKEKQAQPTNNPAPATGAFGGGGAAATTKPRRSGESEPLGFNGGMGGGASESSKIESAPPPGSSNRDQSAANKEALAAPASSVHEIVVDAEDPDAVVSELAKIGWKDVRPSQAGRSGSPSEDRVLRLSLTASAKAEVLKKLNSLPNVKVIKKTDPKARSKSGEAGQPGVADNVSGSGAVQLKDAAKEAVIIRIRKKKSESEQ